MNLHISLDEKFLDYFIRDVGRFTDSANRFVVLCPSGATQHVRSKDVAVVSGSPDQLKEVVGDLRQYDCLFMHFMDATQARIVNSAPADLPIVWLFYGAEAFSLPQFRRSIYGGKTSNYITRSNYFSDRFTPTLSLRDLKRQFWTGVMRRRDAAATLRAMRRADYFGHFLYEDYALIRKVVGIKAQLVDFNFGTFEDYADGCDTLKSADRCNILVGNSGSVQNNHIEAIEILSRKYLGDRSVIVPLSYGGYPSYVQYIAELARTSLGSRCQILDRFMTKDRYNELLASCGAMVMNHYRSQAAGTSLMAFATGARLYMSARSNLYHFFRRHGLTLFVTESDCATSAQEAFSPLGPRECRQNREMAESLFGSDAVAKRYRAMIDLFQHRPSYRPPSVITC